MPQTVAVQAAEPPRQMLSAKLTDKTESTESLRKSLALQDAKRTIGNAIDRALCAAEITKQDAAFRMGYGNNQSPVSHWISGIETPQVAKLWTLGHLFQVEFVVALAAICEQGVAMKTVITVMRKVAADE